MENPKKTVKRLSIGQKKEIIELIQSKRATSATVSRSFGVTPGAIRKILKKHQEILSNVSIENAMENALLVWLVQEKSMDNVVTSDIMRINRQHFFYKMTPQNRTGFNFKNRHFCFHKSGFHK